MPDSLSIHEPSFVNTAGHAIGLLIFGYLFLLLSAEFKARRGSRPRLAATAALLGLIWNGGALAVLLQQQPEALLTHLNSSLSFAALSLLPAVLLSIALEGAGRSFVRAGYGASALAVCLHLAETVFRNPQLHRWGLLLITVAFSGLTVAASIAVVRRTRQWKSASVLAPMALLLFAISFIHFGDEHAASLWPGEIVFHHAGIPLALFIVLQDYRFLLLDAFVRASASLALAVVVIGAFVVAGLSLGLPALAAHNASVQALTFVAMPISLVLFAGIVNRLQKWLTSRVFRRPELSAAVTRLVNSMRREGTEDEQLTFASQVMANHIGAVQYKLLSTVPLRWQDALYPQVVDPDALDVELAWAEVAVPVRLARGEVRLLLLGRRRGGRRYLSEDLHDLWHLAIAAAGQVEHFRAERGEQLAAKAELRALQAQINPHFLFNSLNALYGAIPRSAGSARQTVLNLADIFRYVLQTERQQIALADEMNIVKAYLEIEQLRLGDRLQVRMELDPEAMSVTIPSLSVQPLVENAVKHGVAGRSGPGCVLVRVKRTADAVEVAVEDTGEGFTGSKAEGKGAGVGLENVRQRLKLMYGQKASLHIRSDQHGTAVSFNVPLPSAAARESANAYADR